MTAELWEANGPFEELLYQVWCSALDAVQSKDFQKRSHECAVCRETHMILDERKYVERQRAVLTRFSRELAALVHGTQTALDTGQSDNQIADQMRHDTE